MIQITEELALFLVGKLYTDRSYFNPIQDEELNWYISTQEIEFCTNEEIKPLLPPL
jgi:hypothetical protein